MQFRPYTSSIFNAFTPAVNYLNPAEVNIIESLTGINEPFEQNRALPDIELMRLSRFHISLTSSYLPVGLSSLL